MVFELHLFFFLKKKTCEGVKGSSNHCIKFSHM